MLSTNFTYEDLPALGGGLAIRPSDPWKVRMFGVYIDGQLDGGLEFDWNSNLRSWVVFRFDMDGRQIGLPDFAPNKRTLAGALERMATTSLADLEKDFNARSYVR